MKSVVRTVVIGFFVCVALGFAGWLYIGGYHVLKHHYVQVTFPMTSVSDSTLGKIKEFKTPRRLDFNNCDYILEGRSYADILENADEAEAILEQKLILPEVCRNNEILLEMDKEGSYIELTPKIADINDEWCEVQVYYKLATNALPERVIDEGPSTEELESYTKEEYEVDGQKVSLYYFNKTSYAIYCNNYVTYICKIHTGDENTVKAIVDTLKVS